MLVITSDTREQLELNFDGIDGVEKVEKVGMAFGDYGCILHDKVIPIVFDRKSIGDLYGTMTHGYERWKRLMDKVTKANFKLILIVEGTYSEVLEGYPYSNYEGKSMILKLNTLLVKYDLSCWYCESRDIMALRIVDFYRAIERNYKHDVLTNVASRTY